MWLRRVRLGFGHSRAASACGTTAPERRPQTRLAAVLGTGLVRLWGFPPLRVYERVMPIALFFLARGGIVAKSGANSLSSSAYAPELLARRVPRDLEKGVRLSYVQGSRCTEIELHERSLQHFNEAPKSATGRLYVSRCTLEVNVRGCWDARTYVV